MPYKTTTKRNRRKARRDINIHQNSFNKGYISTIDNSRRPLESLSDMTNMEIVQDYIGRPRPPLVPYGSQPELTVTGRMMARYGGSRKIYWMMDDSGTGKIYKQTDGGAFSVLSDADNSYDETVWTMGVQANNKLYLFNGTDKLSYINLTTDAIEKYTALATPGAPTVTYSGGVGSQTHYYKITANNSVGESAAGVSGNDNNAKQRDNWVNGTDYMSLSWTAVAGATSYTIYYSGDNLTFNQLYTTTTTSWVDYGTVPINVYKTAPAGNSTDGPVFNWMYVDSRNSQLYGITSDNKLYYSASGTEANTSADFSPYNGGGWVGIDIGGDTQLNYVDGFRNGKGDPVITVSARGSAGLGKLFHLSFETITSGNSSITFPNVYEANGQAGTYAPRATIKERDSLWYPTGETFKATGTSQNIVNILTTNTIAQGIEPDLNNISLANLHKAVGVAYRDRLYFALPVGSTENNEIWYCDVARKNLWVLRWPVAAKDMWLYEDNSGVTHFCVLVSNRILEFTRAGAQTHQDDGTAWRSRIGFSSLVWDEDGLNLGTVRNMYFKLLFPKGSITANATGLSRQGITTSVGSDSYTYTATETGYDEWIYDEYEYDADPGLVETYGKSVAVLRIRPKGLLNQLDWSVTADTAGSDYFLSAVNSRGFNIDQLTIKTGV